jgi:beta-glucosidase
VQQDSESGRRQLSQADVITSSARNASKWRVGVMRAGAFAVALLLTGFLVWRASATPGGSVYLDRSRPTTERVDDLLRQMTLDEKVGQMDQILVTHVTTPASSPGCQGCFGDADPGGMQSVLIDNHVGSLLAGGTDMPYDTSGSGGAGNSGRDWAVTYNRIQAFAVQQSRLHIPVLFGVDAVHGFGHPVDAPLFPHSIGMGATWDTALAEHAGMVTGQALRSTGWVENFAPVQDVYRDNRWGRAYEPWSEEPALAGALGAANVNGMQSAGVDADTNPLRVAATLKHLAGNSQSINGHDRVEGQLPIRYLQDVFLPAYKQAIDARARMVMVSSSSIDGVPATASRFLQTTLLRQRLGFKGVTISDYQDVQAISTAYHVAPNLSGAIAAAVNAGLDMAMWVDAPDQWQSNTLAAVEEGQISQSRIDEAVRRILTLKFELGLFDQPCVQDASTPCVDEDVAATTVQAGRDVTLQAARESVTLLKNANNVLPIAPGANVLVTGPNADSMVGQLGGWSVAWLGVWTSGHTCCEGPAGQVPPGTTVLQGLRSIQPAVTFAASQNDALAAAGGADVIVAVVGELAYAEGYGDNPAPALAPAQRDLLTALEGTGKPVIVVVLAGRPLGLGARNEQNASAILMAYQGGTETGQAVADAIFGTINPSGKLPVSWPTAVETRAPFGPEGDSNGRAASPLGDQPKFFDQLPSTSTGTGNDYNPLFSFGFGLSYTTFGVSGVVVSGPSSADRPVSVTFTVTNTGARAGADVVPVFVHQATSQIVVPPHRLVGFARVELAPGESRTVDVDFPLSRLAVTRGDIDASAPPEVERGAYTVEVPTQPAPNDLFPSSSPPLQANFTVR